MIKNGSKSTSQKNLTSGLTNQQSSDLLKEPQIHTNSLHAPVVLEILEEFVLEEERRVVAA